MSSRTALARGAQLAARHGLPAQRRAYAAAANPASFDFDAADVAGIKVAARDSHGPTTKLAVVAKAGTRYQPAPGLTIGLEEFAFKNTNKRSALRIVREAELLGGQLNAYHTREALVVEASFLRQDLPYFAELLAEVVSETKYTTHEFHEDVERVLKLKQAKVAGDVAALALDSAHSVAFHTGLGASLYPTPTTALKNYLNENSIADFANAAYAKSNIALVAEGASSSNVSKWTEQFFTSVPSGSALNSKATTYYGGEQRTAHVGGNSFVIAFPGSGFAAPKPEVAVISALLGGQPNVKWSSGFSLLSKAAANSPGATAVASNYTYSDAGLFAVQINGTASAVRSAALEAAKAIKSIAEGTVSKEDLTKAIAKAKFDALEASESGRATLLAAGTGIVHTGSPVQIAAAVKAIDGVTADKIKTAAKALVDGKATVAAVGDLHVLPYAEELGLKTQLNAHSHVVRYCGQPWPDVQQACTHTKCTKSKLDITLSSAKTTTSSTTNTPAQTVIMVFAWKAAGISYNRYLAVASRVVRRSLKEDKRIVAERRGEMDLRFAKWSNGKMGEVQNLAKANTVAATEAASS
ncbi:Metalloenzyme, LuxS/M16 peptidase-like protein [Microdochium trichocladiopsis]|uniref:Cytochrome b-c1 complex subunit 2, mitochondrial n=1 Tax=Microdochium trichocladiopsis TaxID=1682393 RepID=A0A9P9BZG4_9PEZI|nr:Metalloenzyme, LuxS/M16 peptidase-like protein [Microdochium trichocladiopsis]KAH7040079.1 Metalloenzyme, LuxS/M16 peptidase-like protein [Microdochium trichocladiopsis]